MQITTALVCDFAQVREGLLFVSSGGITRAWRESFPAPLGVCLALVIRLDTVESERPHELEVRIQGEDGPEAGRAQGAFQASAADLEVGERLSVPVVLDLRMVGVQSPGPYDFSVYIDGEHRETTTLYVSQAVDPGGPPT